MPYRVVQWSTGNVGKVSLRAIIEHSDLELVGVHAWGADKIGKDAAHLCGLDTPAGVIATNDIDARHLASPSADVRSQFLEHATGIAHSHSKAPTSILWMLSPLPCQRAGLGGARGTEPIEPGVGLYEFDPEIGHFRGLAEIVPGTLRIAHFTLVAESTTMPVWYWFSAFMSLPRRGALELLLEPLHFAAVLSPANGEKLFECSPFHAERICVVACMSQRDVGQVQCLQGPARPRE